MVADTGPDLSGDPDWIRFDHPDGLFSISHPRRWGEVAPVSKGAALSCRAADGSVLFEVMCFRKGDAPGPGERGLVDLIVDGLVKYAAHETGMSQGRVIAQNRFPFGDAEACTDLLVAYHDAAGVQITVDYFTVGSGRDALYAALKTTTSRHFAELPDFERALGTLKTPWLRAVQAPNLSGGGRPRAGAAPQVDPAVRAEIAAFLAREDAPPPRPRRSGRLGWLVAAAVALAGVWYLFLRH